MVAEERMQASYVGWIGKMNAEEIQHGLVVRNRTFQVIQRKNTDLWDWDWDKR